MRTLFRRLAAAVPTVLLLSLLSLAGERAPGAFRAGEAQAATETPKGYDLAEHRLLSNSIIQIKDNYVDPSRIHPREMFIAALEAVERQVPEVMIETGAPGCEETQPPREPGTGAPAAATCAHADSRVPDGKVRVTVGSATKDFDASDIDTAWKIPLRMQQVFEFVRENLVSQQDQREIEYSAINGMLETLDPHSFLLKPEVYKEMEVQTRGEFGGLGFVISMPDDKLTVRKVLPNTPAKRAGIRRGDVIVQIDNDSTVGMDLNEAVDRMRGKAGSKVSLYVQHKGMAEPRKLDLTRATIRYETVTNKLLPNGVGYVRLSGFSDHTANDTLAAIKEMESEVGGPLKGLVLDLRSNPGGLLAQAIQVSSIFVDKGTVVTTAGGTAASRETYVARSELTHEPTVPMAVLINSETASASEIVAGALKNLNRALIVGRQSFGKGSVQSLYPFDSQNGDRSALKLTIAQYLTPGDISIQEVGITPDIELLPGRILKDSIDLFAPPRTFREQDYNKHFFNAFARDEQAAKASRDRATLKPYESLRYLKEETARERKNREALEAGQAPEEDDDVDVDEESIASDYQIQFGHDLVLQAKSNDRLTQLAQMKPFVEARRQVEGEKVKKALDAMGVDWSRAAADATQGQPAHLSVEVKAPKTVAGTTLPLTVSVKNTGTQPLYRVRAYTKSDNNVLDRREFAFGKLMPGEKRSWSVPVKVPRSMTSRRDDVLFKWEDDSGSKFEDLHAETDLTELPRPAFAFSYQLLPQSGNGGDGLAHKGETMQMVVDVRNVGAGTAYDAFASLRNVAEERINIRKGRMKLGVIKPGESRSATFLVDIKRTAETAPLPIRVELGDRELWEADREKLLLPVAAQASEEQTVAGVVRLTRDAPITASATDAGEVLVAARKGTSVRATGKVAGFYRVEWQKGRMGFVRQTAARLQPGRAPATKLVEQMNWMPPTIKLANLDLSKSGIETDSDHFSVSGVASDPHGLRDLQIFVQHENDSRKVFFRTAAKGKQSVPQATQVLDFAADLPLQPGNNTVYLIAREDDELQSARTLVIHRKQPVVAQKQAER